MIEPRDQEAATAAAACVVTIHRRLVEELRPGLTLAHIDAFIAAQLQDLGRVSRETDERVGTGSTDMGDVSHVVPAIHAWLAICDEGETLCHEHAFARAACSERGLATMRLGAKALARTAAAVALDPALRAAARASFEHV